MWGQIETEPRPPLGSADKAVQNVVNRIGSNWEHARDFFAKFFPVNNRICETFQASKPSCYSKGKWSKIPSNPRTVSELYTPLNNLLNSVLDMFNLMSDDEGNYRLSLNTSKKPIEPKKPYHIWPPLLLAGSGKHFVSLTGKRPAKSYASGIAALEVRLEREDVVVARNRLAADTLRIFSHQHNRRFAFGLVISQQTVTVYLFDHSGVISSPSLNYHTDPEQFCAIIVGLASRDAECLGLDTSMFEDGERVIIRTKEMAGNGKSSQVDYTLIARPYYSPHIVGRATICFAVHEDTVPESYFAIKDSWVAVEELEGKESEASLIAHAASHGVTQGIPRIRHFEEVYIRGNRGRRKLDSVQNNRRCDSGIGFKPNRVHNRLILAPFGKPLLQFSNRKELLLAYHDALQAHRKLYEDAGILHRDIKPENILINPHGDEGNRGILIDFDHAIRIADTSPYSTKRKIGTYLFMSRGAHEGKQAQTVLDDLESFFYVLVFIGVMCTGPGSRKKEPPQPIADWFTPLAPVLKEGFIIGNLVPRAEPWLGSAYQTLLKQLHLLFHSLTFERDRADLHKQPPPLVDSKKIYDTMLSHVRKAIADGDQEDIVNSRSGLGPEGSGTSSNIEVTSDQKTCETTSDVLSWMTRRYRKRGPALVTTLAGNRSKRNNPYHRILNVKGIKSKCSSPGPCSLWS